MDWPNGLISSSRRKGVKAKDIKRALEGHGIEVKSVIEVFREEEREEEEVVPNKG